MLEYGTWKSQFVAKTNDVFQAGMQATGLTWCDPVPGRRLSAPDSDPGRDRDRGHLNAEELDGWSWSIGRRSKHRCIKAEWKC